MTLKIEMVEYMICDSSSGGKDYMLIHTYNTQTGAGWVRGYYGKLSGRFQEVVYLFKDARSAKEHLSKVIDEKKSKGYTSHTPEERKLANTLFGKFRDLCAHEIVVRRPHMIEFNANRIMKATLSQFLADDYLEYLFGVMDDQYAMPTVPVSKASEAKRIQESYGSKWGAWS
ncbi:hypothetical protein ACQ6GM_001529 [Acinetobacter baumannii]